MNSTGRTDRFERETSPYLLQHTFSLVGWHPFARRRRRSPPRCGACGRFAGTSRCAAAPAALRQQTACVTSAVLALLPRSAVCSAGCCRHPLDSPASAASRRVLARRSSRSTRSSGPSPRASCGATPRVARDQNRIASLPPLLEATGRHHLAPGSVAVRSSRNPRSRSRSRRRQRRASQHPRAARGSLPCRCRHRESSRSLRSSLQLLGCRTTCAWSRELRRAR